MTRVSQAIGVVREVLENNYPQSVVKVADSGESDFRVSSVGASISVTAYEEAVVTDSDIEEIVSKAESELSERHLEYRREEDNKVWFDMKS